MEYSSCPDRQRRILFVELHHRSRCYRRFGDGRDGDIRAPSLVREDVERDVVAVAIDEDNAFCRLADEFLREGIRIVVPAVEEHFLRREVASVHRLEYRVEAFLVASLVGYLPTLCRFKS